MLDALASGCRRADVVVANIALAAGRGLAPRLDATRLVTSGYLAATCRCSASTASSAASSTAGPPTSTSRLESLADVAAGLTRVGAAVGSRAVATLRVDFLGCKVSHVDAQELRERLLADGHMRRDGAAAPTSP